MGRPRYFLVAVAAAALLGGCGEETLDTGQIEEEITPAIEEQTGTREVAVECPDDIEAEQGADFECDLTAQGGIEAKVKVTQEDDEGNVHWEVVRP